MTKKKDSTPFDVSKIKTEDEIRNASPIKPKGLWWKEYISNLIIIMIVSLIPVFFFLALSVLFWSELFIVLDIIIIFSSFFLAFAAVGNIGPVFPDKYFGIHYYKKRRVVWDRWWNKRWMYNWYLRELEKIDG